jgi:hypothetical protein
MAGSFEHGNERSGPGATASQSVSCLVSYIVICTWSMTNTYLNLLCQVYGLHTHTLRPTSLFICHK